LKAGDYNYRKEVKMDFYRIRERNAKNGVVEVYPDFKIVRSKDLMLRGRSFYAIWDEEKSLWSTDEYDVQRLVDEDLLRYESEMVSKGEKLPQTKLLSDFSSNSWLQFRNYLGHLSDSSIQLDEKLTFSNTKVKKEDYVSRHLPYPLEDGDHSAYSELMSVLYNPEQLAKLEWAVGAIISGDSRSIQKFIVLYGAAGTGKSTFLNIIQKLFEGYYTAFEAKALTSANNAFATEAFKSNPLVAIQHDGDLSKIEDNTKLNSIISHEDMSMNEKYKPSYMARINAFLFMGTNKPVKITDAKSGIIRRLIDVHPTGETLSSRRYQVLMSQTDFELGAIAKHCLDVYRKMGKNYYAGYRPTEMMLQTDIFFNFIEAHYDIFSTQNGVTLVQAHEMYKTFCDETLIEFKLPRHRFRDELRNYFVKFDDHIVIDGVRVRSWYSGFKADHFKTKVKDEKNFSLVMDEEESLLDSVFSSMPAQYASKDETPVKKWIEVKTTLIDIDTNQLHYTKVPENHIVIDFDLKDAEGNKSTERNLEAASVWPSTYAEFSKSGSGIHLHYIYDGDVSELARLYDDGIEIKVFTGDSSLRRKLSKCNSVPVATINSGLPLREKKVINSDVIKSEKGLRDLISRNLRKEVHPGTKSSVDFIHKILEEAYLSGMSYDVTDMRSKILSFANNSSNQALTCIKLVQTMQFKSEDVIEAANKMPKDERLVMFDVEVFPNLFVICWKYQGDTKVVRMINPTPQEVETLLPLKLVGFNCRRYDNHILYARYMGYTNEQLYNLSQKLISNNRSGYFGAAYNISYADIYDFSSLKQSLKKFEIELGITHVESPLPWDQPVPDNKIKQVVDYCVNDVNATDAVFTARKEDFVAREILADLSGLPVNSTTQQHASKIVFGEDRKPQEQFVYTDLSEMFPGYKYEYGKSTYRDEITGEGGYVYSEPGIYENVALLDVASMHPTSIEALNAFGEEYTRNFSQLKTARLAIKHKDYESAKKMLGGKLARHLTSEDESDALSYALKIVINIVYGLTAAHFDNSFKDPRNIDNIVAKRGALFMVDLKHFVQEHGFTVAHIKTDSIKIPNATPEIIDLVMEFGENYGYTFEHEATYERFCLVNDAVYIAKTSPGRNPSKWVATGSQFAHPYVYKTLFTGEEVVFEDLCETKAVTTALYLDFDSVSTPMFEESEGPHFVGKVGRFIPIKPGCGGGILVREKEGKFHAASGSKGFFWLEAEMVKTLNKERDIDYSYFESLVYDARETIKKFGDVDMFRLSN
jgi:hypothetical protein